MKIRWSPAARASLFAVTQYLSQRSPAAAARTRSRIVSRARYLAIHPYSGRAVPEFEGSGMRELIEAPYRIWYRIRDGDIEIMAVFHGSRDASPGGG